MVDGESGFTVIFSSSSETDLANVGELGELELAQVVHVGGSDLGLGETGVLIQNHLGVPSIVSAEDANNAAGAVLALVAVDEHGVILRIRDEADDGSHHGKGNVGLLGTSHAKDDVLDTIVVQKCTVAVWNLLVHKGDDGLELQTLQVGQIMQLRVAAAIHSRNDECEVLRRSHGCLSRGLLAW